MESYISKKSYIEQHGDMIINTNGSDEKANIVYSQMYKEETNSGTGNLDQMTEPPSPLKSPII